MSSFPPSHLVFEGIRIPSPVHVADKADTVGLYPPPPQLGNQVCGTWVTWRAALSTASLPEKRLRCGGGGGCAAGPGVSNSADSGVGSPSLEEGLVNRGRDVLVDVWAEGLRRVVDELEAALLHGRCGWLRVLLLQGLGSPPRSDRCPLLLCGGGGDGGE